MAIIQYTPQEILRKYWGYEHFRSPQDQIISSLLSGKDTLALLPTGGGKSICYQVPALAMEGVCIVISPLIALMEDQIQQLKKRNIECAVIHSGMTKEQIDITLDNCIYGKIKLLYLSPERIETEIFKIRLAKMTVSLIAVDEAHCISEWGYDFRPAYLKIGTIREIHPKVPLIALTASATERVKKDITTKLNLRQPALHQRSFSRDNISFVVRKAENKEATMTEILKRVNGPAIVYVRSRKGTKSIAAFLGQKGISSTWYHAGMKFDERAQRQEEWITNKKRVMVATNAFGMGIDKPDVRLVIHLGLPESLEAYYQEAGRGGRDGKRSYAVLLYNESDITALETYSKEALPDAEYLRKIYQGLANHFQLAEGAGEAVSYPFDFEEFTSKFSFKKSQAHLALRRLEESGFIHIEDRHHKPATLNLNVDKSRLYQFQIANEDFEPLIQSILRLYGAEVFSEFVTISEPRIAQQINRTIKEVKSQLQHLKELKILRYQPASEIPLLTWITPRWDANRLPLNTADLAKRARIMTEKSEAMIHYTRQNKTCRQIVMLNYFNEKLPQKCGICDRCLEEKKRKDKTRWNSFREQILTIVSQKPRSLDELESEITPPDHHLFIEVIRELLEEGEIRYDEFWLVHPK
ncbi:MAG: RecQ family ATP-dependent DNA helicase [Cyclobacteriaceae bacterium]